MGFARRLAALVERRESQIVLGLDPDPARLWSRAVHAAPAAGPPDHRAAGAVRAHCVALIDAAGDACVAIKPQLACFERLGAPGWAALRATVDHAHFKGLLVLADGKRGDIPVTAAAYAQALMGSTPTPFGEVRGLGADAITANPLMGLDALEPLVRAARSAEAGVFALVRTSNPGAADVEDLELASGGTVSERLAGMVHALGVPAGRRGARGAGWPMWGPWSAPRSRHTWIACASSCRTPCSCCPGWAPRGAASRILPRPSRRAAPAAWSRRRARSPTPTRRRVKLPRRLRAPLPSASARPRGRWFRCAYGTARILRRP